MLRDDASCIIRYQQLLHRLHHLVNRSSLPLSVVVYSSMRRASVAASRRYACHIAGGLLQALKDHLLPYSVLVEMEKYGTKLPSVFPSRDQNNRSALSIATIKRAAYRSKLFRADQYDSKEWTREFAVIVYRPRDLWDAGISQFLVLFASSTTSHKSPRLWTSTARG